MVKEITRVASQYASPAARIVAGVAIVASIAACGSEGRRVLIAVDLSTSMRCPVDTTSNCGEEGVPPPPLFASPADARGTRIAAAVEAVKQATSPYTRPRWFPPGSTLAIWTFTGNAVQDLMSGSTYRSTSGGPHPEGDFPSFHPGAYGAYVDPLLLSANSNTPMYLAIYHGVRALRASWKPGLNVLIVLSDGYDRKSRLDGRRLKVAELHHRLGLDPDHKVHVLVTTASEDVPCPPLDSTTRAAFEYDRGPDCLEVDEDTDITQAFEETRNRLDDIERGG